MNNCIAFIELEDFSQINLNYIKGKSFIIMIMVPNSTPLFKKFLCKWWKFNQDTIFLGGGNNMCNERKAYGQDTLKVHVSNYKYPRVSTSSLSINLI